MTHIFVCPSLRGGLELNKTRFQLSVKTTDYNWCLIPILSNIWKLVKNYLVVLHFNPYESLPRSSQQWVSEPRAIFSRENITHSKAIPTKKESLLFQLREFGGLQLLFGFNASRLCPCTLGWCRSCRDAEVFNVIWLFVHCEPQTKKKSKTTKPKIKNPI